MTNYTHNEIQIEKNKYKKLRLLFHVRKGFRTLFQNQSSFIIMLICLIICVFHELYIIKQTDIPIVALLYASYSTVPWLAALLICSWLKGYGVQDYIIEKKLLKIRMINGIGETPILVDKSINDCGITYTFISHGISITEWENRTDDLQNVMDITIREIYLGATNYEICVFCTPGIARFPQKIPYIDSLNNCSDYVLYLGEDISGSPVSLDIHNNAHILIGGSTGSGKTYLIKGLISQLIIKNYDIHLVDLKGGVDFVNFNLPILQDIDVIEKDLSCIVDTLENRKVLFKNENCIDFIDYQHYGHLNLQRIIFICDEFAALLDKSGLTKEEKEEIILIERHLKLIAQQGRAFGIHLLLGTQRPDADILNGQIKANITNRICGKADDVLSRMILDNSDASTLVPKNEVGIFLKDDGTLFKSFTYSKLV